MGKSDEKRARGNKATTDGESQHKDIISEDTVADRRLQQSQWREHYRLAFAMSKSDEKKTKTKAQKAANSKTKFKVTNGKTKQKATDSKTKQKATNSKTKQKATNSKTKFKATDGKTKQKATDSKNKPSRDATNIEATDDEGTRFKATDGKSKQKATNSKSEFKATDGKTKQEATDGKTKNKPSSDATNIEATDDEGTRETQWREHYRQAFTMSKSDGKKTKKRAQKATNSKIKHKATACESKDKPSSEATDFEAADDESRFHQCLWRDFYRQLCEYKVQFGHCLVPRKCDVNPKLGRWVSIQRTRYKKTTEDNSTSIIGERIRALDGIGFDWGTSKNDVASVWRVRFQELCEFRAKFGDCMVPLKCDTFPKLGGWASKQRSNYKVFHEGKSSPMTVQRIRELESVGFQWEQQYISWQDRFEQLCEYKLQFGHCVVPQQYTDNPRLGQWVSKQRCNYNLLQEGKPSPLTAARIRQLGSLEFKWETTRGFWNKQPNDQEQPRRTRMIRLHRRKRHVTPDIAPTKISSC